MRYFGLAVLLAAILAITADAAMAWPLDRDRDWYADQSAQTPEPAPVVCYEDQPCWKWTDMGNGKRGVVTLYGNYRIVGKCGFQRLWNRGLIRYKVHYGGKVYKTLQRLPGDGDARRAYCGNWWIY